jgi:4-hydroxy-tetrahydrodipicolinate synthase
MSKDTIGTDRNARERREFLQYAGSVALASAVGLPASGVAAPSEPFVPGVSTTQYDKMFVASVTPYRPGTEEIDATAFRNYMRYFSQPKFINAGGGILVSPEAGEAFYTTTREKVLLAEIALEEAGDKTIVFSGAMQNTTTTLLAEARALKAAGVHGIFLMPPVGSIDIVGRWDPIKNPEVWLDQIRAVADAVELPIILHPTGGENYALPLETAMKYIEAVPNIVGYKMITSDRVAMGNALRAFTKRHVAVLPAGAASMHESILRGHFDGTVSGSWNYAMEPTLDAIVAARDEHNNEKAERIWADGLLALHQAVGNREQGYRLHSGYKVTTWLRGLIPSPFLRLPQRRLPIDQVLELRAAVKNAHLEVISDDAIRKAYPEFS